MLEKRLGVVGAMTVEGAKGCDDRQEDLVGDIDEREDEERDEPADDPRPGIVFVYSRFPKSLTKIHYVTNILSHHPLTKVRHAVLLQNTHVS